MIGLLSKAPGAICRLAARVQAALDAYYAVKLNLHYWETPKDMNGYFYSNYRVLDELAMKTAISIRDKNIKNSKRLFPEVLEFDAFNSCHSPFHFCVSFLYLLFFFHILSTKHVFYTNYFFFEFYLFYPRRLSYILQH